MSMSSTLVRAEAEPLVPPWHIPAWASDAIIEAASRMDLRGWVPATAGNLSVRLDAGRIAITRSGRHKGFLEADDLMVVDHTGAALTPNARPSAETLLHCQLYQMFPDINAVLHGHSVAATVLSMVAEDSIDFSDYEVLKAFDGQGTHAVTLSLPVLDNDQDMPRLTERLRPLLQAGAPMGYVLRGHGAYAWGPDMKTAAVRLEALEFLLTCELERRKLR
jgi:methylthioribulose-1-phosphate dehydratase